MNATTKAAEITGEAVGGPFLEASTAIQDAPKDISADDDAGDSL